MKLDRQARFLLREISEAGESGIDSIIDRINSTPALSEALRYLEGKALIKATREWSGKVISIRLLDAGISYLPDRAATCRQRWADRIIGFVFGVASTVAAHFIIQAIQSALG